MSRAPHERQDTSERTRMEAALARAEQQQAELQRRLLALLEPIENLLLFFVRDTRPAVGSVLTHHGAQVWGALSATEALRMLDEDIPSVIISDIAMPDQDGFAFVTAVRQRPRSRGGAVPAIALTAFSRPEDRARSLRSGFQIHLSKPVDVQELLIAVASLARVPAAP